MPGALPFVYQNKKIGWGYPLRPGAARWTDKTIDEKAGRVIGGSSSINAMIYNRGNPMDYEGMGRRRPRPTGTSPTVLPYFRKMETFVDGRRRLARRRRTGARHPAPQPTHQFYDAFLRGGEQAGFTVTPDHNGLRQEGLHVAQSFIHQGVRWSASRAYLRPATRRSQPDRPDPTALVSRLVVDNGTRRSGSRSPSRAAAPPHRLRTARSSSAPARCRHRNC